jgi:hypothetical protein
MGGSPVTAAAAITCADAPNTWAVRLLQSAALVTCADAPDTGAVPLLQSQPLWPALMPDIPDLATFGTGMVQGTSVHYSIEEIT